MFNAFGEGYLWLLKRFLFLSIRRLFLSISVNFYVKNIYGKRVIGTFWADLFGCPYRSNDTKIHLEAALLIPKSLKRFLETIYIVFITVRNFSI